MLLAALSPCHLGSSEDLAPLRFGPADPASPIASRNLFMAGEQAFELSSWCGTCPFLFKRLPGANGTLSSAVTSVPALEQAIGAVDTELIEAFAGLLPEGDYVPLLLEVRPELVKPGDQRDYFTHEQVETWGIDNFWGLPEDPRSFYYRTFETSVGDDAHLYEFVVPMVPPTWNDRGRVAQYGQILGQGTTPTAVALSTLDVCQPALAGASGDYYAHWGLTHFLLDGHHKLEAAARRGRAVRVLAFVSLSDSLATSAELQRLPELLRRPPGARRTLGERG
ncbi:hypothetical protein C6401_10260 [Arthrobacter woluwensis]|nr:hypothetical protein C6401_10260 [Arthrobacter woluwensis]